MGALMRGLLLSGLLIAGSTVFAAERQAEACGDSTRHQAGYCPADLSSGGYSSVGETTVNCTALSDVADGTQYACVTSSSTPLAAASVNACSGGAAVSGNSASVSSSGTQTVGITGLTVDNSYYCQSANLSPEQWYSDVVVSSQFTTAATPAPTGLAAYLTDYDVPFSYSLPTAPTTSTTYSGTQVDTFSEFNAAISVSGARVEVPSGVTLTGTPSGWANDVEVVMPNTSILSLTGSMTISADRVSWTGGTIDGNGNDVNLSNADDILFENVVLTDMGGVYPFFGTSGSRVAFYRVSCRATNYCWFSQGADLGTRTNFSDAVIADSDLEGGYPSGAESTVRWQRVSRGVFVGSRSWNGAKHSFRTHYGTEYIFAEGNQFEGGSMEAHYTEGSGAPTTQVDNWLGAHYIYNNTYYTNNSLAQNVQRGPNGAADFDGPVIIQGNTAYHPAQSSPSGEANRRFASAVNAGDSTSGNIEYPSATAPAFTGGPDH